MFQELSTYIELIITNLNEVEYQQMVAEHICRMRTCNNAFYPLPTFLFDSIIYSFMDTMYTRLTDNPTPKDIESLFIRLIDNSKIQ